MTDPLRHLEDILDPDVDTIPRFPPTSRYASIPVATYVSSTGMQSAYARRRFVPPAERFALIREHLVVEGDRLDRLSATYLGDPELFWRLCDANAAMRPDELTETAGRALRITLPEGLPGAGE